MGEGKQDSVLRRREWILLKAKKSEGEKLQKS